MNKNELRKKYSEIRKSIANRSKKDSAIEEKLEMIASGHSTIFAYVSFGSEVNTHNFIQKNIGKIYIPYTDGSFMECRKYVDGLLCADKRGNVDLSCYGEIGKPTLTIVPLLAFDKACYRLGYGGGYYDKFLSSAVTVKVGVAYDEQLTDTEFAEIFDVPLDIIVTPTTIYKR